MPTNLEIARASILGKRSQAKGRHGESFARWALECYGVRQVVRIEVGWRVKRVGGRIVGATPMEKVTADWRGVWCGIHLSPDGYGVAASQNIRYEPGLSVMAEAKERADRLIWSDLKPHQHKALADHDTLGGLSFIVAIYEDRTVAILRYPCDSLQRGKAGIDSTDAKRIAVWWRLAP
jgi:hypothetical protein